MHELIAIPYPAPSIPARFRLYHGGWAKGGYLRTHSCNAGNFVGPYIYFSPRKAYAASYASNRRHLPARGRRGKALFVVDARLLPSGCLVLTRTDSMKGVDELFWDLFLFRNRVEWWASALAQQGVRSWRLKEAPRVANKSTDLHDAPALLAQWLSGVRAVLLAQDTVPPDLSGLQLATIDQLQRLRTRLGLADEPAILTSTAALSYEGHLSHRLNDPLLFALEGYGTLALDEATVRGLVDEHTRAWITTHTKPFDMNALLGYRDLAAATQAQWTQQEGIQYAGHMPSRSSAAPGDIVMIPGPIKVLRSGYERVRRRADNGTLPRDE